ARRANPVGLRVWARRDPADLWGGGVPSAGHGRRSGMCASVLALWAGDAVATRPSSRAIWEEECRHCDLFSRAGARGEPSENLVRSHGAGAQLSAAGRAEPETFAWVV